MKFSVISNQSAVVPFNGDIWQFDAVSWQARALYVWLSRFDGILPRVGEVESCTGLGRDKRRALYAELIAAGLLDSRVGHWSQTVNGGQL